MRIIVGTTPVWCARCAAGAHEAGGTSSPQLMCVAAHAISQRMRVTSASVTSARARRRRSPRVPDEGCNQRPSEVIREAIREAIRGHPMYRVARRRQKGRSVSTAQRAREHGWSPRGQSRSVCIPGVLHSPSDPPSRYHAHRVQGRRWTVWACGARGSRSAGARVRLRRGPLRARASHYASDGPGYSCLSSKQGKVVQVIRVCHEGAEE